MKKLLPVLLLLVGLGAGVGAGVVFGSGGSKEKPDAEMADVKGKKPEEKTKDKKAEKKSKDGKKGKDGKVAEHEYLRLTKQFVVPIVQSDRIAAMVTVSLSLEAKPGMSDAFYAIEPKLRDRFLQVLFDHANIGGFDGNFTMSDNLDVLRASLLDVARKDLGEDVTDVMIMSVNRQDT